MDLRVWLCLLAVWFWTAILAADHFQAENRAGIITNAAGDYCSGVMISPGEVLTAAHCLFDVTSAAVPADTLSYQAEQFGTLKIERLAIHPGFVYQSGDITSGIEADIALLRVDTHGADISSVKRAQAVYRGDKVFVQRGLAGQVEHCSVTKAVGQIFTLNCTAVEGDSGAAIYLDRANGAHELAGLISAIEMHQESKFIIGVLLSDSVDALRAMLESRE